MCLTRQNPENSDYLGEMTCGGSPGVTAGPNDEIMAPKKNPLSDAFNEIIHTTMGYLGYDTHERTGLDNNDFYRNYAKYMPGYEIDGIPSGAWAQNAATNHVGQGSVEGTPFDNIRRSLVEQESGMIEDRLAAGQDPNLGFWDLYGAHYKAYNTSGGKGNQFIDPGSFALAVYGAPMLEKIGIDSGPFTGAMIDVFNDPNDTATMGWLKRMGLAGVEIAAGTGLTLHGLMNGDLLETGAGLGAIGLGAFGAAYNTASAVFDGGMLGEWGDAITSGAGAVWDGASGLVGDATDAIGGLFSW